MAIVFRTAFVLFISSFTLAKPLVLPIVKAVGTLVITEVKINDKKLKFLIDSGSNATFIDPSALEKLKTNLTRNPEADTYVNTFGGKQKSDAYDFNLKLEGVDFKSLPAYAMNTKKFKEKLDGIECCDGILGIDFIKKFPFEVDIKKKKITIHQKLQGLKSWKVLPVKLEGKNVITFSCSSADLKKVRFRLDTGSEAPLIFHRAAVDKFKLREQAFLQGYAGGGLPFMDVSNIQCGELKVNSLISTFFYGVEGALTHKFVDGNAGAHILGDHYIFDLNNNKIHVKNKSQPFKVDSKVYKFKSNFKFNKGHFSVVNQAQALIINSCSQNYAFQDCMKKLCELEGKKLCVFKESGNVLQDFIHYLYPVKSRDCSVARLVQELRNRPVRYNYCWYKLAEINEKIYPRDFEVVTLKGSLSKYANSLSALMVTNPLTLTKDFYCYSIYEGIINQKSMPASMFGLSVKGLSLSNKNLEAYEKWLNHSKGKACKKHVVETIGSKVGENLRPYFGKKYLALINPFTLLGDGLEEWDFSLEQTLNHEVLHSIYAMSPRYRTWALNAWSKLDEMQKDSFKKAHSSYNFSNKDIIYKEYFSYYYENDPSLLELIK